MTCERTLAHSLLPAENSQRACAPDFMAAPMSLIFALDFQLDRILAEGLENRFARHSAMAKRVQEWAEAHDQSIYAPAGYRSQTVTTIKNDRNISISDLNTFLKQREMRIANGYGQLKDKTFRIAHMGEIQMEDIEKLLAAMEEFLKKN